MTGINSGYTDDQNIKVFGQNPTLGPKASKSGKLQKDLNAIVDQKLKNSEDHSTKKLTDQQKNIFSKGKTEAKADNPEIENDYLKRDTEILTKIVWDLMEISLEDYINALDGSSEKFSRREYTDLTHSIIITDDKKIVPQFHKTASSVHQHQISDGHILIGQGGNKTVYAMGGGLVRQVVYQTGADLRNAIAATKVAAFKNSPYLLVGHYMSYTSKKDPDAIRQVFYGPRMAADMEGKNFSSDDIISTSLQVAKGLKTMHDNGWGHFDIKPANILISGSSGALEAKLMDFDFATNLRKLPMDQFLPRCGTAGYTSPELERGECAGALGGHDNDIFGLGMTILENTGFNLWNIFVDRPEVQELRLSQGDDAVALKFDEYMKSFTLNSIRAELTLLVENHPEKEELAEVMTLACNMIGPASRRPTIDQVIERLEYISKNNF